MAHETGGGAISVNGQVMGGAPKKVIGVAMQLYYADGDCVFATMPPRAHGDFYPALQMRPRTRPAGRHDRCQRAADRFR